MASDGQEIDIVISQAKLFFNTSVSQKRKVIHLEEQASMDCGGPRLGVEEFHAWAGGIGLGQDTVNPLKAMQVTGQ